VSAYIVDWLNILARWVHFVTGIAWIGASFYFIWLDNHLESPIEPDDRERDLQGDLWSVHGGGFYHTEKYRVAPRKLPETLHWFKWEAYSTWLSGMVLLALIYWYGADVYLVDQSVFALSSPVAVVVSMLIIGGGWLLYDGLCRSPLGRHESALAATILVLASLLAWGLCQLFSGRGAYIHFGVVLGTIMVANVFFVIIPGQRAMVDAFARGEMPDPAPGVRAKQRSVHNTYFTLPVLFVMTSNHYAMTYSHEYNWLILIAMSLAGALIRVWFVARHKGEASPVTIAIAVLLLVAVAAAIAPRSYGAAAVSVTLEEVRPIIHERCVSCHASAPTHIAFQAPPLGVVLESDEQILLEAERIHQQTVVTRAMPIGNLTLISEAERELIDAWYQTGAKVIAE